MEFGKLASVDHVDFTLPTDPATNIGFLQRNRRPADVAPTVLIGTAVWGDRRFVGKLYPTGTRPAEFLRCYGRAFRANELNSTYYGVDPARIAKWVASVPAGFRFCPKFPATITHELGIDRAPVQLDAFLDALAGFGERLGRAWVLLPPDFCPRRFGALRAFVNAVANRVPLAIELRHADWFTDRGAFEAVCALFEQHGVALILTDVAGRRDVLHMRLTTSTVFVRFVANGLHSSEHSRLDAWIERLGAWIDAGLETTYFFLHQPEDYLTYESALYLVPRLGARLGIELPHPDEARRGAAQQELF